MAPLTTEPDHLRIVFNAARRQAHYSLVKDITKYMRSQLLLRAVNPDDPETPAASQAPSQRPQMPPRPPTYDSVEGNATESAPAEKTQQSQPNKLQKAPPTAQKNVPPSPKLVELRKAALKHFDSWQSEIVGKLRELLVKEDDQAVLDARLKRSELLAARNKEKPREGEDLMSFDGAAGGEDPWSSNVDVVQGQAGSASRLQDLYHPIPTRLTTIPLEERKEALSATMLLLLSTGKYCAYSRTLACYLASALEIDEVFLNKEETEIAMTMMEALKKAENEGKSQGMSADAEAEERRKKGQLGRYLKVGLASVAGAAIIGVTGGLAAPVIAGAVGGFMGSLGLGGLASFLGIFWMNGALIGTLFGAFGANMTGKMIDKYAKEVEDFKFLPLRDEWGEEWKREHPEARRLRVTIGINGWLNDESDVTKPWRFFGDESEVFALRFEMKALLDVGRSFEMLVKSVAWGALKSHIIANTALAAVATALWPITVISAASNVDNPFSVARNRSEKAGRILADALINKVQGERPVTLVGYSLGARTIHFCLETLAEKKAFGIVDTVVLIGAPVPSNTATWQITRSVVAGKMYNVYSQNDAILSLLYRSTSIQLGVAGLQNISDEIRGIENLDLSKEVLGHLRYPELLGRILTRCGFPNIKGGEEEIEEEDISLDDNDYAKSEQLVDVSDPANAPPPPPRYRQSKHYPFEMEEIKYDPSVKNIGEPKSLGVVKEQRLQGTVDQKESPKPATPPKEEETAKKKNPGEVLFDADNNYDPTPVSDADEEEDESDSDMEMMTHVEPLSIEDDEQPPAPPPKDGK